METREKRLKALSVLDVYKSSTIGKVYDNTPALQDAISELAPWFEYPDWSHKTVRELYYTITHCPNCGMGLVDAALDCPQCDSI
jgi:hypothetical protein